MNHEPVTTSNSSTSSFVGQLSVYFGIITIVTAALIYLMMQFMLQWVEDEVSLNNLRDSAKYVISEFQSGAAEPLVLPPNITAYYSVQYIPEDYGQLQNYPLGFNAEINDDFTELFLYRDEFLLDGKLTPLYITMPAENIELSPQQWRSMSLFTLSFIIGLFILFGYVITKLFRRLIEPINQLSLQMSQATCPKEFTVSSKAAKEFGILTDSLNSYRQQNETLMKQEQAFARYASHELRTPLSIVLGSVKLLGKNAETEFQLRQRDRITRAAQDMQNTVDALLNIVKQEKSADENPPRELSEQELEQAIETSIAQAKQQDIEFIIEWHQTPVIQPNNAVLKMLLTNLINNAINARIELLDTNKQSYIKLIVDADSITLEDNGQGLSMTEKNTQGHGLGLVIIDTLCQRYQWQFSLTENSPNGCIARLKLPKNVKNNQ
ncbi:sensor histidine kinase [Shewanella donghaensis]|uniref:sensor histidine kinase n=1 Tax=Shewanella donghaensis TaxID=238836 RepID=UPI001183B5D7|nr:HAMP domain-containing sensor histidine kinase [Shewanella donghaensis]